MSELTDRQAELSEWVAARRALATGVTSYSIGGRSLTRMDAQTVQNMINVLRMEISELEGNKSVGFVGISTV